MTATRIRPGHVDLLARLVATPMRVRDAALAQGVGDSTASARLIGLLRRGFVEQPAGQSHYHITADGREWLRRETQLRQEVA